MGLRIHIPDDIVCFSFCLWVMLECLVKIYCLLCKDCDDWFSFQINFNILPFKEVFEEREYRIHGKYHRFLSHCGRRLIRKFDINLFICALISCIYHIDQVIENDFGNLPNTPYVFFITFSKYCFWIGVKETLPHVVQESLFKRPKIITGLDDTKRTRKCNNFILTLLFCHIWFTLTAKGQ